MYLARVLPVPVGDEVVELSLDDLPSDIEDYVQVLREERCSAPFWLKLASECGARRRIHDCEIVLQSAIHTLTNVPPPNAPQYRSQQAIAEEVAPFHAMLSTLQLGKARNLPKMLIRDARYQNLTASTPGIESKERWIQAATAHANAIVFPPPPTKSVTGRQHPPALRTSMLLGRGIFLTATGKTDEALKMFDTVLQRQARNPVALLGKACCLLRKRAYIAALKLYQDALSISIAQTSMAAKESAIVGPDGELVESQASKWLGPDPRVGIGLCLHGLGRIVEAQRAWSRAVAVNPTNPAPHLLLGLSTMNMAKQLNPLEATVIAARGGSAAAARSALYKEGVAHIQASWKLDNKNAMTAAALAEHFCVRASATSATNKAQAQQEFERALKLSEHAIQYADNLSAINQARLTFARTAHLYSYLDETSTSTVELRALAQRYYSRISEDIGRSGGNADPTSLAPGHALATLGLAQLQTSRGETLGAINSTEIVLAKPASTSSSCLELSLFAAALRSQSHPGASAADRAADRQRARIILERTMRSIGACAKLNSVEDEVEEGLRTVEELTGQEDGASADAPEAAQLVYARTALAKENLSSEAVREIANLADDELNYVQLAELFRDITSGTPDFVRSASALLSALKAIRRRKQDIGQEGLAGVKDVAEKESLTVRLRTNLGATLALRGIEHLGEDDSFLFTAIAQLQESLSLAGKASSPASLDAEKTITLFNLGRVLEAAGNSDDAHKAYEAVLATHPEYADAKVRMALLHVCRPSARGSYEAMQTGSTLLKEALASDPTNMDTRSAYVCFLAGDLPASPNPPQWDAIKETIAQLFMGPSSSQAVQIFGSTTAARTVSEEARHDAFTLAALAWAYYNLGHSVPPSSNAKKEKLRALLRCCDLLDKALSEDSKSAFAVQGLAILSAEGTLVDLSSPNGVSNTQELEAKRKGGAEDAINMLTKLREVTEDVSVHICMGHAYMARDDYERALRSYELAARKSAAPDVSVNGDLSAVAPITGKPSLLQYLARASFLLGMKTKSFSMMKSSIGYYEQALEQLQQRSSSGAVTEAKYVRYNIAVTRQKVLQMLFDLPMEERQLSMLQEAVDGIDPSQETFKALLPDAQAGKLSYITAEIVEQRILYSGSSLQRQAAKHLEEQREYEERIKAERKAIAARKRERQEALERELMEREEERRRRVEAIEEERKRAIEETRAWEYVVEEEKPRKERAARSGGVGGRKKGKKQRRKMDEGGSEIESEDEERSPTNTSDEGDGMVVSDDAELEQGEFSEEEVLAKPVDSGEEESGSGAERRRGATNGDREARRAAHKKLKAKRAAEKKKHRSGDVGGKGEKRGRKSRNRAGSDEESADGSENNDDRPAKKSKKGRMRRAKDEDLIESEEEV